MHQTDPAAIRRYNAFLLLVAGLGGLLYGIDVGIIGGALPYLEATSGLTHRAAFGHRGGGAAGQRVLHSVFRAARRLDGTQAADDRERLRVCAQHSGDRALARLWPLFLGRLLQGMSGGLIGVVVPLYLAECLAASNRGKGTAIFQWMLTLGIVAAALIGIYFSYRVDGGGKAGRCGGAAAIQESRMAQHLLGIAASGRAVCAGQPVRDGVAAMAVPARGERSRLYGAAALAHPGTGEAGN